MTITAGPHNTAFMPRTCAKCGASYEGTRMLCDGCRIGMCPTCGGPLVQKRGVGRGEVMYINPIIFSVAMVLYEKAGDFIRTHRRADA
jgi:predicted amidophosphoribosyltransferase